EVPAAFHGRVNDVLLTGLALAVAEWRRERGTGDETAVLIDLEGHGREEVVPGVDLSRTVGWFTSIHPVRIDAGWVEPSDVREGGQAVGTALKRVKEQLRLVHAVEVNAHTRDLPDGPELSATWTWAGGLLGEDEVRDLAERWFAALRGLVAHVVDGASGGPVGGFTPSDLSLVDVSQEEIDELAAELDGEWELD